MKYHILGLISVCALAVLFKVNYKKEPTNYEYAQYTESTASSPSEFKIKISDDLIHFHSGGQQLKHSSFEETVNHVLSNLNNLKDKDVTNLKHLVIETAITETLLGKSKYNYSAVNYRNYGIMQIRTETAKDVMWWLGIVDKETLKQVKALYDKRLSLKDNLLYNVKFSIAICAQYYLRRNSNIINETSSLAQRAKQWKKIYNTHKGVGSANGYIKRVNQYYTKHILH